MRLFRVKFLALPFLESRKILGYHCVHPFVGGSPDFGFPEWLNSGRVCNNCGLICRDKYLMKWHMPICIIYWVVPPPSNSGKWRFSSGSHTKNVIILVVTIASWAGDNPNYIVLQHGFFFGSIKVLKLVLDLDELKLKLLQVPWGQLSDIFPQTGDLKANWFETNVMRLASYVQKRLKTIHKSSLMILLMAEILYHLGYTM